MKKSSLSNGDYHLQLKAEAARVWELYQEDEFRELYFHRDQHTAILVLESSSLDAARETLASLPLVRAGLIEFELTPLIPYTGFVRLYASRTEETKTGDILAPTINTLRLTLRPFTLRDDWVIGGSD